MACITGMMRDGTWERGKSDGVLAEEWGAEVGTVERMATECWKVLTAEVADPVRVREDVSAVLMRDVHRASRAAEFNAVAKLGDVLTRVTGARAPEEHKFTGDLSSLSAEQLAERAKALAAKLTEGKTDAAQVREVEGDDQQEHRDGDQGRQAEGSSRGDRHEKSGQGEEAGQAVKP